MPRRTSRRAAQTRSADEDAVLVTHEDAAGAPNGRSTARRYRSHRCMLVILNFLCGSRRRESSAIRRRGHNRSSVQHSILSQEGRTGPTAAAAAPGRRYIGEHSSCARAQKDFDAACTRARIPARGVLALIRPRVRARRRPGTAAPAAGGGGRRGKEEAVSQQVDFLCR